MSKLDVDQTVRELDGGKVPDWITEHLRIYLESGGREGHDWDATFAGGRNPTPCLVLTTRGRRSGAPRPMPLIYGRSGDAYVVIGSKGGAATQPAWYWNLRAYPSVELQVATAKFSAHARIAEGAERERLWAMMVDLYPPYREYQAKTDRQIPVVVLERA
ncbi:MAG: nitroreductase family deazaflavin-dependent oxidoreductase [Gammaproteobacteria bacterium]